MKTKKLYFAVPGYDQGSKFIWQSLLITLFFCSFLTNISHTSSHKLTNSMLKNFDQAGFFDRAIVDIITIRQKVKNLLHGKHLWHGAKISLKTTNNLVLETIVRRPDALYGATFIVISPSHPAVFKLVTKEHQETIQKYIQSMQSHSLLHRQEEAKIEGFFTGSYATHPLTHKEIPIWVADYALDSYDVRNHYAHMAIPAHNTKDFEFANMYHLDIKLVVTGKPNIPSHEYPMLSRDGKHLAQPYTKDDDDIIIINSQNLNGDPKSAATKVISLLQENHVGAAFSDAIMYEFHGKKYSLEQLKTIEETLLKEHLTLTHQQKEMFAILMNYAQADLLEIVEPFLTSIHAAKDLMIELIEESCQIRNNNYCYMLKWSQLKNNESEKVIFKRDIITFQELTKFCADLVNFLGDFASSCPLALDNLKRLKNGQS